MGIDWLLIIVYLIVFIIFSINILKELKSNNSVNMIIICKIFFLIFFFLTPITFNISSGLSTKSINIWDSMIFHTFSSIKYEILLVSIVGYLFLNIGFALSKKIYVRKNNSFNEKLELKFKNNAIDISNNKKYKIVIIILIILGWTCLILWTKVYGGLFGIFNYASKIRSGIIEVYNPFTFLKYFCQLLLIAFLCSLDDFISKKNISELLLTIISGFGSFIYLIANDGRNLILSVFIAIFLSLFYKKQIKIKTIILLFGLSFIGMFFIVNLDNITDGIRKNKDINLTLSVNPGKIINDEYGYIYMNLNNTIYLNNTNQIDYNPIDEFKCILYFMIPQRFKPNGLVNLHDYNDHFYPKFFGTIPPDMLTGSIYLFDYAGIIIIPLFMGYLLGKIDLFFKKRIETNKIYKHIYFLLLTMLPLRICGYFDFSALLFNFVFVYFSLIICNIIYKFKIK